MRHLDDLQLIEAVDDRLVGGSERHLSGCARCRMRVAEMRITLRQVADAGVPEPSPLFWDHFPARVTRALDAAAPRPGLFTAARLGWLAAAAAIVVFGLSWIPNRGMAPGDTSTVAVEGRPARGPAAEAILPGLEPIDDDIEVDAAWSLVRSVAEGFAYDDARAHGVVPRPGSIDAAAMELSAGERAELARLIAQELKRSGA